MHLKFAWLYKGEPREVSLTNARIINPEAGTDTLGSILIENGKISEIYADNQSFNFKIETTIDCDGKCLAPGIIDIGVKIGEPGERHKESFRSAGAAAACGGNYYGYSP